MQQLSLLELIEIKNEAMSRAFDHADQTWIGQAFLIIGRLAGQGREFTSDDVWPLLDNLPATTHERRALGPVMAAASRAGVIEKVPGKFRESSREVCHRNPKQVWKKRV